MAATKDRFPTMEHEQRATQLADTTNRHADITQRDSSTGPPKWRSCRFLLAYLVLSGLAVEFMQRVSFSMVLVCMVNHTALDLMQVPAGPPPSSPRPSHLANPVSPASTHHPVLNDSGQDAARGLTAQGYRDTGPPPGGSALDMEIGSGSAGGHGDWNSSQTNRAPEVESTCDRRDLDTGRLQENEDGPFVWPKQTRGLLLGAMYWGYMTSQILGGYLFLLFGPRNVAGASMLTMAVLTMLCHPAAFWSPWAVFVLRVAIGVCTGFTIPSMFAIWGTWAPKDERATLISLSFSGQSMANIVVFPTTAQLCKHGFAGGWPSVFYVFGLLGVVWCIVWLVFVSDVPETSRWIQPEERDYIVTHRGQVSAQRQKVSVPWCSIFSSICVWAIVAGHLSFTWGLYLFISNLPLYLYEVMNFDIKSNGLYCMLPYVAVFFVQVTGGMFTDLIVRRQILSLFWVRRLASTLASLVPAACLLILSYLECTQVAAVMTCLVLSVGLAGFAFSGFFVNFYDIAPQYAVSIMTVSTSLAQISGIITPYMVAHLTPDKTREQWQIVFFITSAVYLCGNVVFCLFAQTSVQSWAQLPTNTLDVVEPLQTSHHTGDRHTPNVVQCLHAEEEKYLVEMTRDSQILSDSKTADDDV